MQTGSSTMGFFKEFKDFAARGNVVDMAVGIIAGGAFGTIVKSLVDDVIMPRNLLEEEKQAPVAPAPPTTRECPFCVTPMSLKASRCPHCTSEVEAAAAG